MNAKSSRRYSQNPNRRRALWFIWFLLAALWLGATQYSVRFGLLRLAFVVVFLVLWLMILAAAWPRRTLRVLVLVFSALPLLLLLPGRKPDVVNLRVAYVQSLRSYKNVPYVWGGETSRGLDCSGLIRRAIIDANWKIGLRTLNPALLRESLAIWWNDCSAAKMRAGYDGRTLRLFEAADLNTLNNARLQIGDFAVTSPGGAHVLAYIGNQTWIEADPKGSTGFKVIEVRVPSSNAWFSQNVSIMRWKQLQ